MSDKVPKEEKSTTKCPYSTGQLKNFNQSSVNTINLNSTKNSICPLEDADKVVDKQKPSGCPFASNLRKELNTNFLFYYHIPYYHKSDFYFRVGGNMIESDFLNKTKIIREMPRHKKFTLFHFNDEKIQKIRKKDFTTMYFIYEEIKEKAMNFYLEENYRQCINYLNFAYSCFKWIEFKEEERNINFCSKNYKLEPILDEDIIEKRIKTDSSIEFEENTYKGCLILILKFMSFAYMHLRSFEEAINCLDEAISYSSDKVAELYLRRSQARLYNRFSSLEKLYLAISDAQHAIDIDPEEIRFKTHYEILTSYIEEKKLIEKEKVFSLLNKAKYSFEKIKEKNLNTNDYIYFSYEGIENYNEILEEMKKSYKYALKFHTDSNNTKQIKLAFKEYESFMLTYTEFKWYFLFDLNKLLICKSQEFDALQSDR
jgi:hypothetical protein